MSAPSAIHIGATALLALSLCAPAAHAGVIRGTVWIGGAPAPARDAARPDAARQRGVTDAVVWVEHIPERTERALSTRGFLFFRRRVDPGVRTVVQRGRFDRRVTAVAPGTRIAFRNLDAIFHNVFSVSPAARFDTGKNAPGVCDTVRLDAPGVVNLHCDLHPDEAGWIVVAPNHAFARPDRHGRFRLPALPPGTYVVHVFHPRRGETAHLVEVPKRGDVVVRLAG